MPKAKNTGAVSKEAPEIEVTQEGSEDIQQPEKLSLRDALEVAVIATNDGGKDGNKPISDVSDETQTGGDDKSDGSKGDSPKSKSELVAPAEWTKEEKEDFAASTRKQQEAALRLHNSRQSTREELRQERERIKQESAELQWAKDIAREVEPFLKTNGRGETGPAYQQIIKALKAVNELDEGDPLVNAVNYLRGKGNDKAADQLAAAITDKEAAAPSAEITSLREELKSVKDRLAQEDQAKKGAVLYDAWQSFAQEKNAAGKLRFPDVDDSESGMKLAGQIGSLVSGESDLSRQFIANAKARIPDLNYKGLLLEAYKWVGGKIDDSTEAARPQSTQAHLRKSNIAASSKPGRGGSSTSSGPVKKLPLREALAQAVADAREREGA